MSMKILTHDEKKSRILIKGTTATQLNLFRRIIINKVPSMAIDSIDISENSSALYDEMLAHRLGLLPLKTDLKSYFKSEECKCKGNGCARCTLDLTLEAEGPKMVYASDLVSKDPSVIAIHGKTPIVKLLDGQRIKLHAKAIIGTGKSHTKYNPALTFYQNYPTFDIGSVKNADAVIQSCPKKLYQKDGKGLKVSNPELCFLCKACEDISEGNIKVKESSKDFIYTIEPFGQLSAKEIIKEASSEISKQLKALEKEVKSIK
jgi:DNA-directed RNA polymerase subunit D